MGTYYLTAQTEEKYLISLGINAIANDANGKGSYFGLNRLGRLDFQNPFFFGMERKLSRVFSLEALVSINKLRDVELLNGVSHEEDFGYLGMDFNWKLYFEYLFTKRHQNWWDLYVGGGFGLYDLNNDITFTYNVGGGLQLWFNEAFGIGFKGMGKLGIKPINKLVNNYYQFHFGIMYRI